MLKDSRTSRILKGARGIRASRDGHEASQGWQTGIRCLWNRNLIQRNRC